ncbi:beta-1,6-glucan synthase [Methylovorus sp. MM2]|uniref:glycoside hydrolase family 17 protein n=1 Tax=Methylovorus sp. MM2 TaxID=1848038 RepID=UPI0007DEA125|nr:beta-1,6-glucan synthase [Methylovorus sp. MM2]OAM53056.1 beta-1,6-glucan synthase [Methylovorus sp. MM2]
MPNTTPSTLWRYGLFNLVLLISIAAWLWLQNEPVSVVKPTLPANGKLSCVSYAPYYGKGQSPFIANTVISKSQIDSDLAMLAQRFDCVRTYSVSQGLDYVPAAAAKLGLKVYVGAWIGWTAKDNDLEVNTAIKLANQYPDTVKALIIGNEVLLRREQSEATLKVYIDRAKASTKVPVTYADVWEFWLNHKNLEKSVDFVTVHVLPYWENHPQSIDNAIPHAKIVMAKLSSTFTKPILIGETGWPSIGRQRGESVPSQVNQARYFREFLAIAHEKHWQYNLIEAVDQPWKRQLEGTVGGYWGLYNTDMQPKFDFQADVSERQDGITPMYAAAVGFIAFLLMSLVAGERRISGLLAYALLGSSVGILGILQLDYLSSASRDAIEWIALSSVTIVGLLTLCCLPWVLKLQASESARQLVYAGLFLISACATIAGLLMLLDGRYRDFSLNLYMLPILQLSLGLYFAGIRLETKSRFYYWSSILSGIAAIIFVAVEPKNLHAWSWVILISLMIFASWPKQRAASLT